MAFDSKNDVVWIAISGFLGSEIEVASTLKGISDEIGASYSTLKSKAKKSDGFMVEVPVDGLSCGKGWYVTKKDVRRANRSVDRNSSGGFIGYKNGGKV